MIGAMRSGKANVEDQQRIARLRDLRQVEGRAGPGRAG